MKIQDILKEQGVAEGWFSKNPKDQAELNSIRQKIFEPFKGYARNQLIDKDRFGYPTNTFSLFMSLDIDDKIDEFIMEFLIKEYGNIKARDLYKKHKTDIQADLEGLLWLELKNIKQQFKDVAEG